MRVWQRLLAPWTAVAEQHPIAKREPVSDREVRDAAARIDLSNALTAAHADLAGRFDQLAGDLAKLSREQFRSTTLLEGQDSTLDELVESLREHLSSRQELALQERQARADLEARARLELIKDLFPVADALDASVQAARDLLTQLQAGPPGSPPSRPSWLAWFAPPSSEATSSPSGSRVDETAPPLKVGFVVCCSSRAECKRCSSARAFGRFGRSVSRSTRTTTWLSPRVMETALLTVR